MSALKILLRRQKKLGERIDAAKEKFGRTSTANKTEKYFHTRMKEMQKWWVEFRENDKAVMASSDKCSEKTAYVSEKYVEEVTKLKDAIVKAYMEYAKVHYPEAEFVDVEKEATITDEDEDEIEDELDEEEAEGFEGGIFGGPFSSSMNSTKLFNLVNKAQKKKLIENLYAVRANTLQDVAIKLNEKHEDDISEIELDFDIDKLRHLMQQYSAVFEERVLVAKDNIEVEGVRIENEDLINIAERILFSLIRKQKERRQKKNSAPEAPKLQPLKVPKFDGSYQKWMPFLNLFTKVVHDNEKLDKVQRMQYLLDCVEGEPRRIIQHLDLTEENYDSAIGLLKRRYNDERKIICKHLDDVLDHPNVGDDAKGLKSIVDRCTESIHAIKNQGIKDRRFGEILWLRVIEKKLDVRTRRMFEESLTEKRTMPKLDQLLEFLEERFIGMENIMSDGDRSGQKNTSSGRSNGNGAKRSGCGICNEQHRIHQCPKYNAMTPYERNDAIKKAKLCRNCLGGHETNKCNSSGNCGKCSRFHHISLHYEAKRDVKTERTDREGAQAHVTKEKKSEYDVLLATAIIKAQDVDGNYVELRALIDQGSTTSFISEDAAQRLRLQRSKNSTTVTGIGEAGAGKTQGCSTIKLKPRYPSSFEAAVEALILKKLTTFTPGNSAQKWEHMEGLVLADPTYNKAGKIDILLGADVFGIIILGGVIRGPPDTPIAQETEFGWILSGRWNRHSKATRAVALVSNAQIEKQLEAFWHVEDIPDQPNAKMTADERQCEEFYQRTHRREQTGQYSTRLPFKTGEFCLGKSRNVAVAMLIQMEKKFRRDPALKKEYAKCINEYLELGHMELATKSDESLTTYRDGKKHYECYYLPHHAVIKLSSTTTKLRVVFNASQKTNNGTSLNDVMMIGPTIQDDLIDILLRWRKHRIAITADIEKMYRQFIVEDADADYQRIVWRNSEDEPIRDYRIKRVCFGNASAPFMAIRSVRQLAKDELAKFPKAAIATESDFYVDDLISGGHTVEETSELQRQLRGLMQAGRLNLRKWATNVPACLDGVPEGDRETKAEIELNNTTIKMLGVQWDPKTDNFTYCVNLGDEKTEYSKRKIVSEVAQLFDPLGWLAPVVVLAKIQLQELWVAKLDWDAAVPPQIDDKWRRFRRTLSKLNEIRVARYVGLGYETASYELHGFCDASIKAYAAAVYLRCVFENGDVQVHLLVSKSRVAPTKTISIPRLELCGALLLANLMAKVNAALKMKLKMNAWTDSMVTLAWINGNIQRWESFVANRVTKIRELVECEQWHHVGTKDNPADVASRGMDAADLGDCDIWWVGPKWLSQKELRIGPLNIEETTMGMKKKHALVTSSDTDYQNIIQRFSSYDKLIRVVAYCQRFVTNCRDRHQRRVGALRVGELRTAEASLIKWAQKIDFAEEIHRLEEREQLNPRSSIAKLSPFLHEGILRVRGRIQSKNLPFARRHPIIMAYGNVLTTLIIENAHKKTLHGGNQLTSAFIRQRFWILKMKRAVKTVVRRCVTCFKFRAQTRLQQMGNLPIERTMESRPFTNTGVDFCGPFDIKNKVGRGSRTSKGYVAIFICLATKAIHIEVVSDLTSEGFIAAFRRMIGRRGGVAHLFSDNGTNFVGANRIIRDEYRAFLKENDNEMTMELAKLGTDWHFIPPSAPHFGGLWEAGVKSIKHHLKRVIGDIKLTYEEMSTVLCQIEACLNSRPLCPMSEDPEDLQILTPGHFLIGEAPTMPPETDYQSRPINRLNRWQLCSKLHQDFWRMWRDEYLSRLQQRTKWLKESANIRVGDMVLVKDERTPSSTWPLGRIIETHPGNDDLVRVVDVRIGKKTFRRPITKICVLPIADNEEQTPGGRDDDVKSPSKTTSVAPLNTTLIAILVLLFGLISAAAGNSIIDIQQFNNSPVAYVENMGDSQVVNGNWNLLVYYDLEGYLGEFNLIWDGLARLERKCDEIGFDCVPMMEQFKRRLHEVKEINGLLLYEHGNIRHRRQIAAAVGGLALGGWAAYTWLTKNEANDYAQAINNLKANQQYLLTLSQNQTSVLELTDNLMKRSIQHMDDEHEKLRSNIERLAKAEEKADLGWQVHSITTQYLMMLESYAAIQGHIMDATMAIHNGRLHPLLISPTKMQQQLDWIERNVGHDFELPETLQQVYQTARVKVRLAEKKLIFRVAIPILRREVMRMWRIIPIPQASNGTFWTIQPSTEYLLVNHDNETYYDMTALEREACDDLGDRLICRLRHPMFKFGAGTSHCEMELIRNETLNPGYCQTQKVILDERWIRLSDLHSWIFAINGSRQYLVSCEDMNRTVDLTGSGLLRLPGNCSFESDTLRIATSQLETKMTTGYLVAANISSRLASRQIIHDMPVRHINITDLDIAIKRLESESNRKLLDVSIHDWHQYGLIYGALIIIIIGYAIRRCSERRVNHAGFVIRSPA